MVHRDDPSLPSDAGSAPTDGVDGVDGADRVDAVDGTTEGTAPTAAEPTAAESPASDAPAGEQPAVLRRHVKMRTFLLLGLLVGLVLSVGFTFGIPDDPGFRPANPELQFSDLQVFAFLLVFICPITLGLGGLIGYLVGNVAGRRSRTVVLQREQDRTDAPEANGEDAASRP